MHRRTGPDTGQASGTGLRRFPTSPTGPRLGSVEDAPFSESPVPAKSDSEKLPKTAAEAEEEEESMGGVPSALAGRLAAMEKRQVRIEELLMKLVETR
jgi:hypothetical protein